MRLTIRERVLNVERTSGFTIRSKYLGGTRQARMRTQRSCNEDYSLTRRASTARMDRSVTAAYLRGGDVCLSREALVIVSIS